MKIPYKKLIGISLIITICYFLGAAFYKEWDNLSQYNWSLRPVWLISSILTLFLAYVFYGIGWTLILQMIGVKIGRTKGTIIFLLSIFGRYVPGGIWSALGRLYLCRLEGIPDSKSGISILLEQAYPVVSAGFVFVISLLFWTKADLMVKVFPLVFILPVFVIFLHPKPFLKIVNPVLAWVGRKPINISLSFKNMLFLTCYYFFYWIITGIAFYFFINAFYPLELSYIPILTGVFAISFTAGYLAFITPAGLGVREGLLSILLSQFLPTSIAIGLSLLSRLWFIGLEIIILMVFLVNPKTRKITKNAIGW